MSFIISCNNVFIFRGKDKIHPYQINSQEKKQFNMETAFSDRHDS